MLFCLLFTYAYCIDFHKIVFDQLKEWTEFDSKFTQDTQITKNSCTK